MEKTILQYVLPLVTLWCLGSFWCLLRVSEPGPGCGGGGVIVRSADGMGSASPGPVYMGNLRPMGPEIYHVGWHFVGARLRLCTMRAAAQVPHLRLYFGHRR